jgi:hypothetical protein
MKKFLLIICCAMLYHGATWAVDLSVTTSPVSSTITFEIAETLVNEATPAGGTSPYTYRWTKNGTETTNNIAGATKSYYTIASATTVTPGNYYVVVTDAVVAVVASNPIRYVFASLATSAPAGNSIAKGDAFACATIATGGASPYVYQWYKTSIGATAGTVGSLLAGATTSKYTIASVISTSQGAYSCVVTDSNGTPSVVTSDMANLYVLAIATQSVSSTVSTFDSVTFQVTVTGGYPPYYYRWTKGGTTTAKNITDATLSTYTIAECHTDDASTYNCVLLDDVDVELASATITLTVNPAEYIPLVPTGVATAGINLMALGSTLNTEQPYLIENASEKTFIFVYNAGTAITLSFDWYSSTIVKKKINFLKYTVTDSVAFFGLSGLPKEVINPHDKTMQFTVIGAPRDGTIAVINLP